MCLQVRDNPSWFLALVWGELLLQLPFFIIATYAFATRKRWIRFVQGLPALCPLLHYWLACMHASLGGTGGGDAAAHQFPLNPTPLTQTLHARTPHPGPEP